MINGVTYQCVIVLPIMEYRGEGASDRTQNNDDGPNPEEENEKQQSAARSLDIVHQTDIDTLLLLLVFLAFFLVTIQGFLPTEGKL